MADLYEAGYTEPSTKRNIASMANWAGAGVSLLLIAGIGIWGYQLLVRDVSGVPVVRATQGAMRVAPETPGGRPADHQGLAVNSVAGFGVAEEPADRLVLAPKNVTLQADDKPSGQIAMPERLGKNTVESVAQTAFQSGKPASIQELADQIAGNAAPLSGALLDNDIATRADDTTAEDEPVQVASVQVAPQDLGRSLRPVLRPAGLPETKTAAPAAAAPVSIDVAPEDVPAGTRLVQFGAYASPEIARTEWDRLSRKFADFIEGKQRVIQRAESGGKTFFRLRALGFEDVNDARQFCAAIVAGKAECIPVVMR